MFFFLAYFTLYNSLLLSWISWLHSSHFGLHFIFLLFLFCLVQFLCYSQQFLFSIGPILERNPGRSVIRFTGLACSSQLSPYYGPFFSTGGQNLPIYASTLTFGEGNGTPLKYSCLEGPMAWMEEPGRLRSMGSLRVGHDWVTSLPLFTFLHWKGEWQPTPAFLPGESQGRGSLVGWRLWCHTESDTTEVT